MVIQGKFGNGNERKTRLEKLGYDYNEVQERVNEILTNSVVDYNQIAREVILGKWDVGQKRIVLLKQAGYDYDKVQRIVNEMLR